MCGPTWGPATLRGKAARPVVAHQERSQLTCRGRTSEMLCPLRTMASCGSRPRLPACDRTHVSNFQVMR